MLSTVNLVLLLFLSSPAGSATEADILWTSLDRTTPLFLPASVLSEKTAEKSQDLAVSRNALENIKAATSEAWNAQSTREAGCAGPPEGDIPGETPGARPRPATAPLPSILKAVRDTEVVFTAEVSELVPGWIPARKYVGTLVRVRVLEVISDPEGTLYEGKVVAYLQEEGELKLGNRILCTKNPAHVPARVGDRLLVTGFYDSANPDYISSNGSIVFHVRGELVLHPPSEQKEASDGLPLSQVRRFPRKAEKPKP